MSWISTMHNAKPHILHWPCPVPLLWVCLADIIFGLRPSFASHEARGRVREMVFPLLTFVGHVLQINRD